MYLVVLTNFGTVVGKYDNLDAAFAAAIKAGFEATILNGDVRWAWSLIGGKRFIG